MFTTVICSVSARQTGAGRREGGFILHQRERAYKIICLLRHTFAGFLPPFSNRRAMNEAALWDGTDLGFCSSGGSEYSFMPASFSSVSFCGVAYEHQNLNSECCCDLQKDLMLFYF